MSGISWRDKMEMTFLQMKRAARISCARQYRGMAWPSTSGHSAVAEKIKPNREEGSRLRKYYVWGAPFCLRRETALRRDVPCMRAE